METRTLQITHVDTKFNPLNNEILARTPRHRIVEACGLLPQFFMSAVMTDPSSFESLRKGLDEAYGFGPSIPLEATILADGMYRSKYYPDDPDMVPLLCMTATSLDFTAKFYVYQYGIIALVVGDKQFITRMD